MARKVKCEQCGAKNAADSRRCRICGAVVNAEVVETHESVARGRFSGAGEAAPPTDEQLRAMGYDPKPVAPTDEPPVVAPDEHFDPTEFEMPWTKNLPPPPTKDDPLDPSFDHFDPNDLQIGLPENPRPTG
jgi:hypothetical protein